MNIFNSLILNADEHDECATKGICNINPTLSSIHEIILLYLSELSFYLIKLKDFGIENESIQEVFNFAIFNIVSNVEYNQKQFGPLISKLYDFISQSKSLYNKHCLGNNFEIETRKSYFKYCKDFTVSEAIRKGEKYFLKKSQGLSPRQKNFFDIMLFLVKSIGLKLIELNKLDKKNNEAYYATLSMLSKLNVSDFSEEEIKAEIDSFIPIYYNIVKQVFYTQAELYGKSQLVEVSFTQLAGKAILVSGSDFKKLERVLKAAEGTEINVYTHGLELLMAHTFPKLRNHPNLKGHFGLGLESSIVDFASFPGSILMTMATLQRVEHFYKGRLFTLDEIALPGVVKIKDYDFEPLINSALNAKGFTHTHHKPSVKVGYDEAEISQKVSSFVKKMKEGEAKYFSIIGLLNILPPAYKNYFDNFFELLPDDFYVFSLSYPIKKKNIFYPNSFCYYTMFYFLLRKLTDEIPVEELNLSIFITRCDKHIISNVLYLRHLGIKNIYMVKCPVSLINPNLVQTLQECFDIKEVTDPSTDLKAIILN